MSEPAATSGRSTTRLSIAIGAAMTALATVLMLAGVLAPIERITLDWRFRLFTARNPAPSDRIVHLDIDDGSIRSIGRWPWPRAKLADLVDEVAAAGAKVIAFDVLVTERQPVRIEVDSDDGGAGDGSGGGAGETVPTYQTFDDDALLADAIRRAGNVILAVDLTPPPKLDELAERVIGLLESDLAKDKKAIAAELHLDEPERRRLDATDATWRTLAVRRRLTPLFADPDRTPTLADCRAALLPNLSDLYTKSTELELIAGEYDRIIAMRTLSPLLPPIDQAPATFNAGQATVPIPPLAATTAGVGAVSFRHDPDGVVRMIPLWLTDGERLYPHLALATACRYLGVDPRDVAIAPDRTTIRPAAMPDGSKRDITIPLLSRRAGDGWQSAHGNLLVTWPTAHDWPTLFDPAGVSTAQHVPTSFPIQVAEMRRRITHNEHAADKALLQLILRPELQYSPTLSRAYHQDAEALYAESDPDKRAPLLAAVQKHRKEAISNVDFFAQSIEDDTTAGEADRKLAATIRAAIKTHGVALAEAENARVIHAKRAAELRSQLDGRIVLVGWTGTGAIADFVTTSLQTKVPGPVIHGAVLNAILTDHFITRVPNWVNATLTIAVGLIATLIAAYFAPVTALLATTAMGLAYGVLNGVMVFDAADRWAVVAAPGLAAIGAWAAVTVFRLIIEQRQRLAITRQFKNYIDPSLVELLVANPTQIVTGEHELTCMFSDIKGFTTISEKLGTERTSKLLNVYLARATDALMAHRGTVNKYLGDGIMAFWGAPIGNERHALDTCVGVLAVIDAVNALNNDPSMVDTPELFIRMGVATGPMMVGDFGAPPRRSDYTVIGDTVNFSARLESANKQFGTRVLISQRTRELVDAVMLTRPIGRLVVVGKSQSEPVYELLNTKQAATEQQRLLAANTTEAVEAYYAGDFRRCRDLFTKLAERFERTLMIDRYLAACDKHLEAGTPAEGFEGTLVLSEK